MKKSILVTMNPCKTPICSQRKHQSPLLHSLLMLSLFASIYSATSISSSSSSSISYSDHCASIVPDSTPTVRDNTIFPHLETRYSHYTGVDRILSNVSSQRFSFRPTQNIFKTKTSGVYKVQAYFQYSKVDYLSRYSTYGSSYNRRNTRRNNSLRFLLNGFWSQDSGKLCMVGSASWYSKEGNPLNLEAVLKLSYAMNSTITTSLVTGTLESLSSSSDLNYFEPISILAFAESSNYNYTLVSEELDRGCPGGNDIPQNQSIGLQPRSFCSWLWGSGIYFFQLEYKHECFSLKNCTPLSQGIEYLPTVMSLNVMRCLEDEHKPKIQYLVKFGNDSSSGHYGPFDPVATLVAEGSWDENKNRLCIVACRILNSSGVPGDAHVGDCSIRLSLRFPAFWSIRNTASTVGEIWTNKTVNEPGYFNRIKFGSSENGMVGFSGFSHLTYKYTEMERVRKSCPVKKPAKGKGERYPKGYSNNMRFDMSVKDSMGKVGWGYADPIFVGDYSYQQYSNQMVSISAYGEPEVEAIGSSSAESEVEVIGNFSGPSNISYRISISKLTAPLSGYGISSTNLSFIPESRVEISAEGVYDGETGHLCMVGCRKLDRDLQKSTNDSMDCELLLKFQFPPVNSKNGGLIKGSIESLREKTDPLFFKHVNMSSTAFYTSEAQNSIWRMDLEITMVLISNTLACVFVGLQLFYVKKNPNVLPFMSLVMLVILTLGHMVPLVLNFEALILGNHNQQSVFLGTGGWLEVNEVIVRVVTMVAFLLQFRLLQLAWSAHSGDENQKGLWIAEKKELFVSLPLYIVGILIALLMNMRKNKYSETMVSFPVQEHSLWGSLRSYGGLVLDGFLLPQILLNIFRISREIALSHSFYIGTTFVRLLPHAYDLYRAQNYAGSGSYFNGSYIYANPSADFYSTAWDVIIPCGGVLFAVIMFFQQRFGGRCFLPRTFREVEVYEKVPVVSSE